MLKRIAALAAIATVVLLGAAFARQAVEHRRSCPGPDLPRRAVARAVLPLPARTGQLLVAHDRRGDASVVDLATGEATYIRIGLVEPHEVAVSADGRWGIVSDFGARRSGLFQGNRVAVIDMRTRSLARILDLGESRGAHGVAFVPGTATHALVTTQSSRQILDLDVQRGIVTARIATGADGSHLVAVSPDGRYAYTANESNGTVSRLDLAARRFDSVYRVAPKRAEGIALSPDGRELWVGGDDPGVVYVLDAASGRKLDSLASGFRVTDRILLPGKGERALVVDVGCIHVIDRASRRDGVPLNTRGGSFAAAPDGNVIFLPGNGDEIAIVDVARREEIARIPLRAAPHGIAWGPTPSGR